MNDKGRFEESNGVNHWFEFSKNQKDILVQEVQSDIYVRMDGGGCESVTMVFTKEEFGEFIKNCIKLQNKT